MNQNFMKDLLASGYVHAPLALHPENSLEAVLPNKEVLARKSIWYNGSESDFIHNGTGKMFLAEGAGHDGSNAIAMGAPLRADTFPDGTTTNGQYANFGTLRISLPIERENWEAYNRITFHVRPDYQGGENVHMIAGIYNDGKFKLPDRYYREGFHVLNLENHKDNLVIWEFEDLPRDCVTEVTFYMFLSGNNGLTSKEVLYYIDDVALEKVEYIEHAKGWKSKKPMITYPTSGYLPNAKKTAVSTLPEPDTFTLIDAADGSEVFTGKVEIVENFGETFGVLDFSAYTTPGEYRIRHGEQLTDIIPISESVVEEAAWKIINFLFCQRCGYPVPGIHEGCHHDMIATHGDLKIAFYGGWHDAGDLTQSTLQTTEIAQAMFEAADNIKEDSMLKLRLLEEAEWGIDMTVRSRFGDGYRVDGEGCIRYTDGLIGNFDDIKIDVSRRDLNNFICAGAEAHAGIVLGKRYAGRGKELLRVAKEDFGFAMEDYEKNGYQKPMQRGHERTTGESLFYALASEAASRIYEGTGESYYAQKAVYFADLMLKFQETGDARIPLTGFFYRDIEHKYPQHFNHQSREQGFMRALVLLCNTQPEHEKRTVWEASMKLYANYLKDMMKYAAPYGMIPSGVYSVEEAADADLYSFMHPATKYEVEKDNVLAQIKNGVKLSDKFYLRVFPVWTSFRGNAAVHCAAGKAATMLGKYFKDDELMQIGLEQLYWIAGKNPFLQSIIYGEGKRYAQQYGISTGEVTGEIPVGIESFDNEDIPYWPQGNNCTYKEVWTSPAGRWMWVAADLL